MRKHRARKIVVTALAMLLGLFLLIILFISPITKYLIEKYDVEYTGREIKMDWAYVNPFTGYAYFDNFRVYEREDPITDLSGDSVFFSSNGIGIYFSIFKAFRKEYEVTGLTLYDPKSIVIQMRDKHLFNFTDLLEKFSTKDTTVKKEPVHFSLEDVRIRNGEFHFRQPSIPVNYFVKNVNMESSGYRWNVDSVTCTYAFVAGIGSGEMKGEFTVELNKRDYKLSASVKKYDLNLLEQYMKDFSNYGTMRAFFDAEIKARGNFNDARALDARGKLTINDFHFGKDVKEDYASFDRLAVGIRNMSPYHNIFDFDTLSLHKPMLKYERYDHLDNFQNIFGKKGSKVKEVHNDETHFNLVLEIADYLKKLVKNFFRSYYKINHFEIAKANFIYSDFSLNEKFSIAVNPLSVMADSIDKNRSRARMAMRTGIYPYGHASVFLSVNPKDSSDFDLDYSIQKVPVSVFNPYLVTYTSYNMDRGTVEFKGNWKVRNGNIQSSNHMLVLDPRIEGRVKEKGNKWIPLPLVMAFVRERGNVIDYDIPITGDLKDPKFHISDALLDLLKNIFIKPPTTPYGVKVTENEQEIEKSLTFKWRICQSSLKQGQERFLKKMAEFFKKNASASVTVYPIEYEQKEKEHILLFEARKKYFMSKTKNANSFSLEDSVTVERTSVKDGGFVKFLDAHAGPGLFTVQDKCLRVIGAKKVDEEFRRLNKAREMNFISYFKKEGVETRVKMVHFKSEVPYNGFSFFKIVYNGDMPAELQKAYEELNELDEWFPRSKYHEERKKIRNFLKLKLTNTKNNEVHSSGPLGGKP